jgi:hypothetical protein
MESIKLVLIGHTYINHVAILVQAKQKTQICHKWIKIVRKKMGILCITLTEINTKQFVNKQL